MVPNGNRRRECGRQTHDKCAAYLRVKPHDEGLHPTTRLLSRHSAVLDRAVQLNFLLSKLDIWQPYFLLWYTLRMLSIINFPARWRHKCRWRLKVMSRLSVRRNIWMKKYTLTYRETTSGVWRSSTLLCCYILHWNTICKEIRSMLISSTWLCEMIYVHKTYLPFPLHLAGFRSRLQRNSHV